MMERPTIVTDAHLGFLDALRENGKSNMYLAASVLMRAYKGLSQDEASTILRYWMGLLGKEVVTSSMRRPKHRRDENQT